MQKNDLRVEALTAATTRVLDAFKGTDATTLPSHTPDIRPGTNGWGNNGSATFGLLGAKANMSAGVAQDNNVTIDAEESDVTVECDVTMPAADGENTGIVVRSSANDTNIEVFLISFTNLVIIVKNDGGTRTPLDNAAVTINASQTYRLRAVCKGTTIEAWVDGVKVLEVDNSHNQSATRHGLFQLNAITDAAWDNFRVQAGSEVLDVRGELTKVQDIEFGTGYPGGLYLAASMFVPREIVSSWLIRGAQRLRILNGQAVVFEGLIADLERALTPLSQGVEIEVIGHWGALLGSRRLQRLYADGRTAEDVWLVASPPDVHVDQTQYLRYDADQGKAILRATPQSGVTWGALDRTTLAYLAPTGEEIRRVDFTGQLDEAGQNWRIRIRDRTNNVNLYTRTATGTDSAQNVEPADGCLRIDFHLTNIGGSTIPGSGAGVFGELRELVVYATMHHTPGGGKDVVDLTEITKDIRAELTELSQDEDLIDSNTLSLVPFINEKFGTIADMLIRAASFGDASQNRWAVGIRGSHLSTDGKPKIFAEQYPDLLSGDFEYQVALDDENLDASLGLSEGFISSDENAVWNWIIVEYQDEQGFQQFVTPDDDANLKDDDSIAKFGRRDQKLSPGSATTATAVNYGRRFLAAHKDAVWNVKQPITVIEYIRGGGRERIPASEIRAGKRLRMSNFIRDPLNLTNDLIFLVTKTRYRDEEESCEITVGLPNTLDVYLAQRELVDERIGA